MKKIFFISSTILFLSFLLVVGGIKAGSENNVSGWAWTETTGWISFNNISGGGTINYGVGVETSNGFLSGYAWSENIGWIKMDPESPYPGSPGHSAKLNLNTKEFSGWARACAGSPNGDCTGGVGPGVNTGGWDGWIKLDGATLDTIPQPNEFMGWAWGSDVVGWNSFNCRNQGVCGTSNYKVVVGLNRPPTVAISCDPSTCEGFSGVPRGQPGVLDIVYSANDPDENFSWQLKVNGETKISGSDNVTNERWLASSLEAGNYTATIEATDDLGLTAFASVNFRIKQDAVAGFMCTLNKPELPNCQPDDSWKNCDTLRPFKGQWVYLKDDPNLSEHSIPSEGATITNRTWRLNGIQFSSIVFPQGCPSDNSYEYATAPQIGVFKIRLDITDSNGRADDVEHTLNGRLPPPDWIEIPPF